MATKDRTFEKEFGKFIAKLLVEREMSQRELADLMGTHFVTINRYIHGTRTPKLRFVVEMMDKFGYKMLFVPKDGGD